MHLGIARSFLSSAVRWDRLGTEHLIIHTHMHTHELKKEENIVQHIYQWGGVYKVSMGER